jgi:hypothetical protein
MNFVILSCVKAMQPKNKTKNINLNWDTADFKEADMLNEKKDINTR